MDRINLLKLTKSLIGQTDVITLIESAKKIDCYLTDNSSDKKSSNNNEDFISDRIKKQERLVKDTLSEAKETIMDFRYLSEINKNDSIIFNTHDIDVKKEYIFNFLTSFCFLKGGNCLVVASNDKDKKLYSSIFYRMLGKLGDDVILTTSNSRIGIIFVDDEGETKNVNITFIDEKDFIKEGFLDYLREQTYDFIILDRIDTISFSDVNDVIYTINKLSTNTKLISFHKYVDKDIIETFSEKTFIKTIINDGALLISE